MFIQVFFFLILLTRNLTQQYYELFKYSTSGPLLAFLGWQGWSKGSAEGKEPAGTTAITAGRVRKNTTGHAASGLSSGAGRPGSQTAVTKTLTPHP